MKQGLEGLLEVVRSAHETASSVHVVLLGDGSQLQNLRDSASGISSLTLLDPLPDGELESALAAADVLVLHEKPGVAEMSVPSKLTSYFSAGRPVVAATNHRRGAEDLMARSGAGTVVDAGNAAAILGAIEEVASDAGRSIAMGRRAQSFAQQHLSTSASLQRYAVWVNDLGEP